MLRKESGDRGAIWAQQNQLRVEIEEDIVPGGSRLTLWSAYASSVDNVTGGGWTTVGVDRAAE